MNFQFSRVMMPRDWARLGILLVVAIAAWGWLYVEMQKPIVDVDAFTVVHRPARSVPTAP